MHTVEHSILTEIDQIVQDHRMIGIQLSGGLDSALMSYLLLDASRRLGTNNGFEYITTPKFDGAEYHARNIARYLDQQFDRLTKVHVVGNPRLHHTQQAMSGLLHALRYFTHLDVVVNASNATPDPLPGGPVRIPSTTRRVRMPFFNYTKDVLVSMLIDRDLTKLMELSHTCTETTMIRCRECWQCRERAWAFSANYYTDPGIM